jgi:hypothetical protein
LAQNGALKSSHSPGIKAEINMKTNSTLLRASLIALALVGSTLLARLPIRLDAQENVLQSTNPDLLALRSQREALLAIPFDSPVARITSPDAQALGLLDEAESSGESELRAVIDLLAVYENLQCGPDRAMVKPLLEDRLRLYSRLLGLNAEKAALPLGQPSIIKLEATSKKALKLHDDLLAAKNRLDAIAASLK